MTHLQRYRNLIRALSPSGDPKRAIELGYYVEPPSGSARWRNIATSLELEPTSTHLVVGGVGSGKSTTLIRSMLHLEKKLSSVGDFTEYCDVSMSHDLTSEPTSGVLFALAGQQLIEMLTNDPAARPAEPNLFRIQSAAQALQDLAYGYTYSDDVDGVQDQNRESSEVKFIRVPGVLKPPPGNPSPILAKSVAALGELREATFGTEASGVMFFDSLDRLSNPYTFMAYTEEDIAALKESGIGTVTAGPVKLMFDSDRSIMDIFDHVHFQLALDPNDAENQNFLRRVLAKRAEDQDTPLTPDVFDHIILFSGGSMRDMLSIAKMSGEQAYALGHSEIKEEDVAAAATRFGASLISGLSTQQFNALVERLKDGGPPVRDDITLSLVETRRILVYERNRYAVHPALRFIIKNSSKVDQK